VGIDTITRIWDMTPHNIDWERARPVCRGEGSPRSAKRLRRLAAPIRGSRRSRSLRTAQRLRHRAAGGMPSTPDPMAEALDCRRVPGRSGARRSRQIRRGGPLLQLTAIGAARRRRGCSRDAPSPPSRRRLSWSSEQGGARTDASLATTTAGQEYTTLRGQRLVVYLPDRTQVTLAPESHLRLAPDYGVFTRDVELHGSVFVVCTTRRRPFSVRGDGFVARIWDPLRRRSYPGDTLRTVFVAEGVVGLNRVPALRRSSEEPWSAARCGALGRVTSTGELAEHRNVSADAQLAWTAASCASAGADPRRVVELGRW